jgi:acetylornithine deacetylase/succinyl-diaminopimelate desuccinylase-like protein
MHVVALRALLAAQGALPVNVKLLIEGEEEVGSAHLAPLIAARRDALAADLALISDTTMYAEGLPALCYGLRGMAYFEVEVQGASGDLHSGSYGGAVPNPLQALTALLAGLKDEHGRIAIPAFYDDVRTEDPEERDRIAALPHDDASYAAALGLSAVAGEEGFNTLERTWTRPSLDINGIWGGYAGPGSKTVLPARGGAKLSFRLVPDQDPDRVAALLTADLQRRCPPGIRLTVQSLHGASPWVTAPDHPYMQAAGRALERAFGRAPVYIREGGSIPVVTTFDALLGAPIVLLGVALHEDGAHAPNEHFSLDRFHGGARAAAYFYQALGGA